MFPPETTERWAAKTAAAPGFDELRLPYSSLAALVIAGATDAPLLVEAVRWVASVCPDELPVDGGAARCKDLDAIFRDNFKRATGRRAGVRVESVWYATDEALHYISPPVRGHMRWPWDAIDAIPLKHGRRDAVMKVREPRQRWELRLGNSAMANVLAVAAWARQHAA